jgi:glyoxalase family protein
MQPIEGLHHITSVAGDPQRNIDFYRNILGQRMIKKTVNFDDPTTYHLYYADASGTPGTVITFFPWTNARKGLRGNSAVNAMAYNIPEDAMEFWQEHLHRNGIHTLPIEQRFGEKVLAFDDPDGMQIELVAGTQQANLAHWNAGPIEVHAALQGFHSATLWLSQVEPTAALLTSVMGYTFSGQEGSRYRFTGGQGTLGSVLDLVHRPEGTRAVFGTGSFHHIAFRVPDDQTELQYLQALRAAGMNVSDVRDRNYFHSIYYRVPGGVLFEIATNHPGFTIDEPMEKLGETLKLPAWYEPQRTEIEASLVPLTWKPIQQTSTMPERQAEAISI